jgi:hypothetical protein
MCSNNNDSVIFQLEKNFGKKFEVEPLILSARSAHVGYVLRSTVTLLVGRITLFPPKKK